MRRTSGLELILLGTLAIMSSFMAGQLVGAHSVKQSTFYLSVKTTDFAWGNKLYQEAKASGGCFKYEKLAEPRQWWLHSC